MLSTGFATAVVVQVVLASLVVAHMTFDTTLAWCEYHCNEFTLDHPTNCSTCRESLPRRLEDADTASFNLIACDTNNLHLNMTAQGVGLHQFWTQFQRAMEHALAGSSKLPLRSACDLSPQAPLSMAFTAEHATTSSPVLVYLNRSPHEHECIRAIHAMAVPSLSVMGRSNGVDQGHTSLLVHATSDQRTSMLALTCVGQVLAVPPLFKLSPLARSVHATFATTSPPVHIALLDGASIGAVLESLNAGLQNATGMSNLVHETDDGHLAVRRLRNFKTWATVIAFACRHPHVHYVTRAGVVETFDLPSARSASPSTTSSDNQISSIVGIDQVRARGILGNGVVVGISDSGLYLDHDQFDQPGPREFGAINSNARKVVLYEPMADTIDQSKTVTCGHGTHVSGILAGSSWSQQHPNVGVAPMAKIAFADIGTQNASCANNERVECPVELLTPPSAMDLLGKQVAAGAKIFSFSWGVQKDDYSKQAQNLDEFVFDNPDVLIVIAAGNGGDDGSRTISSPAGAKNVITVGASMSSMDSLLDKFRCPGLYNPHSIASFSSRGPTSDGRMKPDLVAPGELLWSARSEGPGSTLKTSALCPLQGTSQATPVVAGLAALTYEWLRDGWWHKGVCDAAVGMSRIPASLIKALLIHSSQGLERRLEHNKVNESCSSRKTLPLQYPDMNQGYGLPDMSKVANFGSTTANVAFWPNAVHPTTPSVAHGGKDLYRATLRPDQVIRATLVRHSAGSKRLSWTIL
ncbi:hypothetical protein, variant [Aphanomyces invadans]|uniref:subtilisin n=1 Tax=Aphanomyces invadans TaxID=157072 RepID=A0A024TSN3_9STRA|nr:hypothetical protein, variant [Aphanomyces invadans]ETV97165.1 hypothetical protein, variant [Aphanomyces invadans]|eukprot:XP_008874411.1 hypothetical protein, variant [Aphanomyces invadans]